MIKDGVNVAPCGNKTEAAWEGWIARGKRQSLLVSCESDWTGLYVDGELKYANHSIGAKDALKALNIEFRRAQLTEQEMDELGELPHSADDLPVGVAH